MSKERIQVLEAAIQELLDHQPRILRGAGEVRAWSRAREVLGEERRGAWVIRYMTGYADADGDEYIYKGVVYAVPEPGEVTYTSAEDAREAIEND